MALLVSSSTRWVSIRAPPEDAYEPPRRLSPPAHVAAPPPTSPPFAPFFHPRSPDPLPTSSSSLLLSTWISTVDGKALSNTQGSFPILFSLSSFFP